MSRTLAFILLGVVAVLAVSAVWSNWASAPVNPREAGSLEIYAHRAGEEDELVGRWRWESQEGAEALRRFLQVLNTARPTEVKLTGSWDYQLRLVHQGETWLYEVFGDWMQVKPSGRPAYVAYVREWEDFQRHFIASEFNQNLPTRARTAVSRYMAGRVSGEEAAVGGFLTPDSFYRLTQLQKTSWEEHGSQVRIKGYDLKEVRPIEDGVYTMTIRLYGVEPTSTWEEEYEARPMGGRYVLSFLGRRDYVVINS